MTRRIDKAWLARRVSTLNVMLERPTCLWNPGAGAGEQNVGHLQLDKGPTGYKLEEITSPSGGATGWSPGRLSPKNMDLFIDGLIRGIFLRNAHITQKLAETKS